MKNIWLICFLIFYRLSSEGQIIAGQSVIGISIDTVNFQSSQSNSTTPFHLLCDSSISINVNSNTSSTSYFSTSTYITIQDSTIEVAGTKFPVINLIQSIPIYSTDSIFAADVKNNSFLIDNSSNLTWYHDTTLNIHYYSNFTNLNFYEYIYQYYNKYIQIRKKYGNEFLYGWIYSSTQYSQIKINSLTRFPKSFTVLYDTACNSSYTFSNGITLNNLYQDTIYDFVLPSSTLGCDSLVRTKLSVNFQYFTTNYDTICKGSNYQFLDGSNIIINVDSFIHYNVFTAQSGCDSIIKTLLKVNGTNDTVQVLKTCGSNYIFPDSTILYNIQTDTIQTSNLYTINGCDSFITTKIVFQPIFVNSQNIVSCNSYFFNNQLLTNSGIYYDTLQNSLGCDSLIELHLTINSITNNSIIQNNDTLSSTISNANYQWLTCNPYQIIPNEINQNYVVTSNGAYAAVVTQNGCSDTSNCFYFSSLGIINLNKNEIIVFPNPANSMIYFKNANDFIKELYNTIGQLVFSTRENEIDVSHLPRGLYYLKVGNETKKVIIE